MSFYFYTGAGCRRGMVSNPTPPHPSQLYTSRYNRGVVGGRWEYCRTLLRKEVNKPRFIAVYGCALGTVFISLQVHNTPPGLPLPTSSVGVRVVEIKL